VVRKEQQDSKDEFYQRWEIKRDDRRWAWGLPRRVVVDGGAGVAKRLEEWVDLPVWET
jgi:hypothetical protein